MYIILVYKQFCNKFPRVDILILKLRGFNGRLNTDERTNERTITNYNDCWIVCFCSLFKVIYLYIFKCSL